MPRPQTCHATAGRTSPPPTAFHNTHVFCVLVDGNRIWAGTEEGLSVYEKGKWKTYTTADGLAHRVVLSLALDKRTGDVWAATMGGLSRISGGHIDTYTQLNSGLSNDVVYGVARPRRLRLDRYRRRRLATQYPHRPVDSLQ